MEKNFWLQRWQAGQIAFHEANPNALLLRYWHTLQLEPNARCFLPLCGKTLDIHWLLAQGLHVVGAELSRLAIEQLFTELNVQPTIRQHGALEHWQAPHLDMFVGDVFQLTAAQLGTVDAVYDRAALVALPAEMRDQYAAHVSAITALAPQLLITYEYDQLLQPGPPFAVLSEEVLRHYQTQYQVALLDTVEVVGGLRGQCAAQEKVWYLISNSPRPAAGC